MMASHPYHTRMGRQCTVIIIIIMIVVAATSRRTTSRPRPSGADGSTYRYIPLHTSAERSRWQSAVLWSLAFLVKRRWKSFDWSLRSCGEHALQATRAMANSACTHVGCCC